jgi:predicted transposase YbfD/YdcC
MIEVPQHLRRATKSWTNLQTLAMVRRTRQVDEKTSQETHYFISSLALSTGAEELAKAVRSHWSVENELHWSLDVGFREDACQVRKDNAPANFACIRRMALTQLKQETSKKLGIQGKRRRAGWDQAYMETVLRGAVLI